MNQRLAAGALALLSTALIAAESILAARYGFDPGLILFCLSIYGGLCGLLFSLKGFPERQDRIESVSERRSRAMREGRADSLLKGYDIDEEFLEGASRRSGKPSSAAPAPSSQGGSSWMDAPAPDIESLSISRDRASFDEYIRRNMTEADDFLEGDGRTLPPEPTPEEFSHDPKAVISKLNRKGERL